MADEDGGWMVRKYLPRDTGRNYDEPRAGSMRHPDSGSGTQDEAGFSQSRRHDSRWPGGKGEDNGAMQGQYR